MVKVNILTPFKNNIFLRQLDQQRFSDFIFSENGCSDIEYDYVIVYEGINNEETVKCKPGNLIFISGEPPDSRKYLESFLKQFDIILSSHKSIKKNNLLYQQALPWHFGYNFQRQTFNYSYNDLLYLAEPIKSKKISIISSFKTMMPGHKLRYKFISEIIKHFSNDIDVFGKDYKPVEDKADAILPYKMSICIENSSIDDYWTEKLSDVYLGYTIPIYYGCRNIEKYFSKLSMITFDIKNLYNSLTLIEYAIKNCDEIYQDKLNYIKDSRIKILEDYNLFPVLVNYLMKIKKERNNKRENFHLKPNHSFFGYKTSFYALKFERYFKGLFVC
jgi:hypothetical protein